MGLSYRSSFDCPFALYPYGRRTEYHTPDTHEKCSSSRWMIERQIWPYLVQEVLVVAFGRNKRAQPGDV